MDNDFFKPSKKFENYINDIVMREWFNYNNYAISLKLNGSMKIGYISSPMTITTGINKDIKGCYDAIIEKLLSHNIYPINMNKIIDEIPDELDASYIDIMHLCFALLNISDIIFVNVTNNDWLNSRGVLSELSYAKEKELYIKPVRLSIGLNNKIKVECEDICND